jgi:hypothetical protein
VACTRLRMRAFETLRWGAILVIALAGGATQAAPWQPTPGHVQIPLWTNVPDAHPVAGEETAEAAPERTLSPAGRGRGCPGSRSRR